MPRMARLGWIPALTLNVICLTAAGPPGAPEPGGPGPGPDLSKAAWELAGEGSQISVFRWDVPESPIRAFRAVGEVDASVAKVVQALTDAPRQTEWMPDLDETVVLQEVSPVERIQY